MVLYEELSKGNSVLHQKIFTDDDFPLLASDLLAKKQIQPEQSIVGEYKESIYLYRQLFRPKPCLIIFGSGPDVKPVVQLASRVGFIVMVCDWRPSLCHKDNLPDADQCILGFPEEMFDRLVIHQDEFVVIMAHKFRRDQEIISKIMKQPSILLSQALFPDLMKLKEDQGARQILKKKMKSSKLQPFPNKELFVDIDRIEEY